VSASSKSRARHAASRGPRHASRPAGARRGISVSRVLAAFVTVSIALCVGLATTGGTYALWNKRTAVPVSTISSGSAALAMTPVTTASTKLYPGATSYETSTLTNAGDVSMALSANSLLETGTPSTFSAALVYSIGVVSSAAECTTGFTGISARLGALSPTSLGVSVPRAGTAILCVATTLPATAPAASMVAASPTFTLTIGGTQS
jgi:hypothetical protein